MKEKKKTGEAERPLTFTVGEWLEINRFFKKKRREIDDGKTKLINALSAFNRRYRSRQREEKE